MTLPRVARPSARRDVWPRGRAAEASPGAAAQPDRGVDAGHPPAVAVLVVCGEPVRVPGVRAVLAVGGRGHRDYSSPAAAASAARCFSVFGSSRRKLLPPHAGVASGPDGRAGAGASRSDGSSPNISRASGEADHWRSKPERRTPLLSGGPYGGETRRFWARPGHIRPRTGRIRWKGTGRAGRLSR